MIGLSSPTSCHPEPGARAVLGWGALAALDFPGFGAASPVDRVTLAGLADYVLGQISEPVTLVGVSLGGMVAQQVAVREPDAVASLVGADLAIVDDREPVAEATSSDGSRHLYDPAAAGLGL